MAREKKAYEVTRKQSITVVATSPEEAANFGSRSFESDGALSIWSADWGYSNEPEITELSVTLLTQKDI